MYLRITISKIEFKFYLSKACFTIASKKKEDSFKQMSYFGLGLWEYNRYLRRHLGYHIKDVDIEKIFSHVSLLDNGERTKKICSLSDHFKIESDRLKVVKFISSELMKSENSEIILIQESLKLQLRAVGAILAAAVPIVISIISLLLPHKS